MQAPLQHSESRIKSNHPNLLVLSVFVYLPNASISSFFALYEIFVANLFTDY